MHTDKVIDIIKSYGFEKHEGDFFTTFYKGDIFLEIRRPFTDLFRFEAKRNGVTLICKSGTSYTTVHDVMKEILRVKQDAFEKFYDEESR